MTIFEAAAKGDVGQINEFIRLRVDINSRDEDGWTPLQHAVVKKQFGAVREALRHGAKLDCSSSASDTLTHIAVHNRDPLILGELIRAGIPVDVFNRFNSTPLHIAAGNNDVEAIRTIVRANGNTVNLKQNTGKTALTVAISMNSTEAAKELLNLKAKVEIGDLHAAAYEGNKELVELLINAGADVNEPNNQHQTSLDYAFWGIEENGNNDDTVNLLLKLGAKTEINISGDVEMDLSEGNEES